MLNKASKFSGGFTKIYPPSITSPIQNGIIGVGVGITVTTTSSAFSSYGRITHSSTDWQIASDVNFSNIVYQSLSDATNKLSVSTTSISTPGIYYIRSRYRASNGSVSDWSSARTAEFKTLYNYRVVIDMRGGAGGPGANWYSNNQTAETQQGPGQGGQGTITMISKTSSVSPVGVIKYWEGTDGTGLRDGFLPREGMVHLGGTGAINGGTGSVAYNRDGQGNVTSAGGGGGGGGASGIQLNDEWLAIAGGGGGGLGGSNVQWNPSNRAGYSGGFGANLSLTATAGEAARHEFQAGGYTANNGGPVGGLSNGNNSTVSNSSGGGAGASGAGGGFIGGFYGNTLYPGGGGASFVSQDVASRHGYNVTVTQASGVANKLRITFSRQAVGEATWTQISQQNLTGTGTIDLATL